MNRIKILLVAILTIVLLTISVSGTLAWLQDNTDEVKNIFIPGDVDTDIIEDFDKEKNQKKSIQVRNDGNIPVYVRVVVVGNWVNNGQIVASWEPIFTANTGWLKGTNGYYYYTVPLEAGVTTSNLLGNYIAPEGGPAGAHLEVTVIHQAIQAEAISVVANAWGVTLSGTTITGPTAN